MSSAVSPSRHEEGDLLQSPVLTKSPARECCTPELKRKSVEEPLGTPQLKIERVSEDCSTPILCSQSGPLSQSQECVPLYRYQEELRKASISLQVDGLEASPVTYLSKASRSSSSSSSSQHRHRSLSIKTDSISSDHSSTDPEKDQDAPANGEERTSLVLPTLPCITKVVYGKLKRYIDKELDRVSSPTIPTYKTPAKSTFYNGKNCPPLKKINRRACSPALSGGDQSPSPKRAFFSF